MQDLTITLVQTELAWQDPEANRDNFSALIEQANEATDLIVLPEMFTTGFTMDARDHAEPMDGASIEWMAQTARRRNSTICGSLIIEEQGQHFNRFIWMPPNGALRTYDKRHLFRMANEQEHYVAGRERKIFELNEWRICPMVCYDLRFPVWSRGINEFDLLIYVANWPATRGSAWRTLLPARAVENLCYVAGVNRIGSDGNERSYSGDSVVVDYLGQAAVDCQASEQVATTILDAAALARYRKKFPAHLDADTFEIDGLSG